MYNNTPKTLFIGQNIAFLPSCHSTNDTLMEMLNHTNVPEGTVVITHHQIAGRGQRGNRWEAEPARNLTFSLLIKPTFITAARQFDLNIAVALACYRMLSAYFTDKFSLKWPNDLYYQDLKMGGILIENTVKGDSLSQSVIGVGLNVNQMEFENARAVSMRLAARQTFQLEEVLHELLEHLEATYLQLRAGQIELLRQEYLNALYAFDQTRLFRAGNQILEGRICGVDQAGHLAIEIAGKLQYFAFKEIAFVWE